MAADGTSLLWDTHGDHPDGRAPLKELDLLWQPHLKVCVCVVQNINILHLSALNLSPPFLKNKNKFPPSLSGLHLLGNFCRAGFNENQHAAGRRGRKAEDPRNAHQQRERREPQGCVRSDKHKGVCGHRGESVVSVCVCVCVCVCVVDPKKLDAYIYFFDLSQDGRIVCLNWIPPESESGKLGGGSGGRGGKISFCFISFFFFF